MERLEKLQENLDKRKLQGIIAALKEVTGWPSYLTQPNTIRRSRIARDFYTKLLKKGGKAWEDDARQFLHDVCSDYQALASQTWGAG